MESERRSGEVKKMLSSTVTLPPELQQLVKHCPLQADRGNASSLEPFQPESFSFSGISSEVSRSAFLEPANYSVLIQIQGLVYIC